MWSALQYHHMQCMECMQQQQWHMVSISTKEGKGAGCSGCWRCCGHCHCHCHLHDNVIKCFKSRKEYKRGKIHMLEKGRSSMGLIILFMSSQIQLHTHSIFSSHISGYILKIFPFAKAMEFIKDSSSGQKAIIPYTQVSMPAIVRSRDVFCTFFFCLFWPSNIFN